MNLERRLGIAGLESGASSPGQFSRWGRGPARARRQALLAVLLALPTAALGQDAMTAMAERHRTFLEEEVVYIIAESEREAFLALEGEELRDAFIAAFWRRRDPDSTTPENEFREEHAERIAYANEFYGRDTGRAGWRTDRGRYHITLGPPRTKEDLAHSDAIYPAELWFYNDPALLERGLPPFFYLLFFRRFGAGEMRLYSPIEDGPQSLLVAPSRFIQGDFRQALEAAYNDLYIISPELASAAFSFRTDEGSNFGDIRGFGTVSLLDEIWRSPTFAVDTSYAERFDPGAVESDYLFNFVRSDGVFHVLPGPGGYYLHWAIEAPATSLAVVRDPETGRHGALFIASVEVSDRDDPGRVFYEDRAESTFAVSSDETGALGRPFLFRGTVPVISGSKEFRVVLRNRACPSRVEEECLRAYTLLTGTFEVPEVRFDAPQLTVPVLGWETEVTGDALYRGYRFGRRRIAPNPSRVFSAGEMLTVLSEPLNAPEGATVEWSVSADPEDPTWADGAPEPRIGSVPTAAPREGPLVVRQALDGLPGGRYRIELRLAEGNGTIRARHDVPFTVTPRAEVLRPAVDGGIAEFRPEVAGAPELARARQWEVAGDSAAALAWAESAVAAGSGFVPAREFLGGLLLRGDDGSQVPRVVELLAPVFEAHPDRYDTARNLGEARVRSGDFEGAVAPLVRAMELRAPDADLLVLLATARLVLGEEAEAARLLDRAHELDPENERVLALRRR